MSDKQVRPAPLTVRMVEEKPQPKYEYQKHAIGSGSAKAEPLKPTQRQFEALKNLCFQS